MMIFLYTPQTIPNGIIAEIAQPPDMHEITNSAIMPGLHTTTANVLLSILFSKYRV